MKVFENPEIEVVSIEVGDIITTSDGVTTGGGANGNEGGSGDED